MKHYDEAVWEMLDPDADWPTPPKTSTRSTAARRGILMSGFARKSTMRAKPLMQ
ncbi:hypothetical protein SAMN05216550_1104 [Paraburkholderia tropica]|uniref:Uncharacterized protein n=1 Tax=Paraburkholderia tropica TaxID=92647 RepID=A0AAQ1GHH9_9BURK|nr:hypothetical protein SAMN05216550_1104 [Paraburkholderia tropica]